MFNILIYKVFRRGQSASINMFVSFKKIDCVESILYNYEYKFGTCRVEFIGSYDFVDTTLFECMIDYANHLDDNVNTIRKCNDKLIAILSAMEKNEAKRHCQRGFQAWLDFIGIGNDRTKNGSKNRNAKCFLKFAIDTLSTV